MCRNYRELSAAEVGEIARLYPVTTNREIARRYDISVDALQDYLAYPNGWKKDRKAMSRRVPKLTVAAVAVEHCPGQHHRAVRLPSNAGQVTRQGR